MPRGLELTISFESPRYFLCSSDPVLELALDIPLPTPLECDTPQKPKASIVFFFFLF